MESDPDRVARLAIERQDENWRFMRFLKRSSRLSAGRIDALAARLAAEAETRIDCTECGACCRDNCITVNNDEIAALARRVDLDIETFRDRYIIEDDDGQPAIDATPCPFLNGRRCTIYEDRPEACRGYPYIGMAFVDGMVGFLERAGTCPIIFETFEQLKRKTGFSRYV